MDIHCPTCGEPWEAFHLRHDEPHEWHLADAVRDCILATGRFSGSDDPARLEAQAHGWVFATNSVLSFTRCPCCPAEKSRAFSRAESQRAVTSMVAELFDDDEDALTSTLASIRPSFNEAA